MDALEIVAALLGVANILLLVRRSVWNYAFGLAMVALFAPIFFKKQLYGDALLQVFFFLAQVYGLWNWRRAQAESGEIRVDHMSLRDRLWWTAGTVALIAVGGTGLARYTNDPFPYLDATNAVVSVVAQLLLARRLIENWALWVFVDVIQIGLYIAKDLKPTAMLYVLFLLMSVWGWIEWRWAERRIRVGALA